MNMLNDFESEDEEINPVTPTKKNQVLDLLKEKNLIKYGAIITESDIEIVMETKKEELKTEAWMFVTLQLREIVKSQGFYITSRGHNNSLYILLAHEMPAHNEKKHKATFRNLKQRTRALHMIDQSLLSDEHQKKLEFEIFRNARFELEMGDSIKKRCRY